MSEARNFSMSGRANFDTLSEPEKMARLRQNELYVRGKVPTYLHRSAGDGWTAPLYHSVAFWVQNRWRYINGVFSSKPWYFRVRNWWRKQEDRLNRWYSKTTLAKMTRPPEGKPADVVTREMELRHIQLSQDAAAERIREGKPNLAKERAAKIAEGIITELKKAEPMSPSSEPSKLSTDDEKFIHEKLTRVREIALDRLHKLMKENPGETYVLKPREDGGIDIHLEAKVAETELVNRTTETIELVEPTEQERAEFTIGSQPEEETHDQAVQRIIERAEAEIAIEKGLKEGDIKLVCNGLIDSSKARPVEPGPDQD